MPNTNKSNDTSLLALSSHITWMVTTSGSQVEREEVVFNVLDIAFDSCLSPLQKKQFIGLYLDSHRDGFEWSVSRDCLVSSLLNLNSSN